MPAMITHDIFAKDVLKKMDKKSQNRIKNALDYYGIFAQSFDNFFYYRKILPSGKNIRLFGDYCQLSNTQSYFLNMIRIIMNAGLTKEPTVMAYLYGSITHYVLDSVCHPYVFYKTGPIFDGKNKNTYKYNGLHYEMEYMIDAYIYETRTNNKIYKYKFTKDIMPKVRFNSDLVYVMDKTFKKTFNKDDIANTFLKSYRWSRFLNRLVMYDKTGLKKTGYKFASLFLPKNVLTLKYFSYHIKDIKTDYLNLDNKTWNHPGDKNMQFSHSFFDLYDIALDKTINIINAVNKVMYEKDDIKNLLDVIPNISYRTGLLINQNQTMKYFEF